MTVQEPKKEHRCAFCKTEFNGTPLGRCLKCGQPRCPGPECYGCLGYC